MSPYAEHAQREHILREEGYDLFDLPRLHASEIRRVFEGRAQNARVQRAQKEQRRAESGGGEASGSASDSFTTEPFGNKKRQMKRSAKQNAIEEYKKDRGLK